MGKRHLLVIPGVARTSDLHWNESKTIRPFRVPLSRTAASIDGQGVRAMFRPRGYRPDLNKTMQ